MFQSLALFVAVAALLLDSARVGAVILKEKQISMSNVSVGKHFASFGFNNRGLAQLRVSPITPENALSNLTIAVCTESEMSTLYSLSVKEMCYAKCTTFCIT